MVRRALRFALVLAAGLLSGCLDYDDLIRKLTPAEDDRLAREFLELVRTGQTDAAIALLDPSISATTARTGLAELRRLFDDGIPLHPKVIGVQVHRSVTAGSGGTATTSLQYEIRVRDAWLVGTVIVVRSAGSPRITTARFNALHESLRETHAFDRGPKLARHYLMLLGTVLVPVFCAYSAYACFRQRPRRRWLWLLFILLPVGMVQLNWTTGEWNYQLLSFSLLGATAMRASPYTAWVLSLGFPLGALTYWLNRRQLPAVVPVAPPVTPPLSPSQ